MRLRLHLLLKHILLHVQHKLARVFISAACGHSYAVEYSTSFDVKVVMLLELLLKLFEVQLLLGEQLLAMNLITSLSVKNSIAKKVI